ncbi:Acetyltransferase (GNAT) domain-containing protein [Tenacibaculum sp. MAR_2009_124]|uniref:GNAT family N-acetyltransferase n=1 Tax=Tenacibaculum sp. MAR_2009_124 TaxID=1250059 RepID=UPI0008988C31|nr:GNAT family N-acetyltransferase [Tenacibaculum sp. MAR_2009_124]SEC52299.1 Acetyltransferase (GNAT) domain-containing protein [Tenacibaculum sp. MAR_2009_124]
MVNYKTTENTKELSQILTLQAQNLPTNLSEETKKEQGFVSVHHDLEILETMHNVHPHIIAVSEGNVAGYALSMSRKFRNDIPVLAPMFLKIDASKKGDSNYLVMGQVCVAKDFRGKGVFRGLYTHMKKVFSGFYDSIITEINAKNTRSINAHSSIGFDELMRYDFEGETWVVVFMDI